MTGAARKYHILLKAANTLLGYAIENSLVFGIELVSAFLPHPETSLEYYRYQELL